ncbi:hypothetical protein [Bacillus thuringiensis]|uniref:hypothetical protein n=1 Tax=Bacillus thuringiensis TaxID=1428 RepID=UPI003F68AC85
MGCQDHGVAIVITPGRHIEQCIEFARKRELGIIAVTKIHIHADFISGAKELALSCNAMFYASAEGGSTWKYQYLNQVPYHLVRGGSEFHIGTIQFQVIHMPGPYHRYRSSVCEYKRGTERFGRPYDSLYAFKHTGRNRALRDV